jgi:hypothetical protein
MSTNVQRSIALADKITAKAEDTLWALDQEITKWPADFAAIMWDAVSIVATTRAQACREREKQR